MSSHTFYTSQWQISEGYKPIPLCCWKYTIFIPHKAIYILSYQPTISIHASIHHRALHAVKRLLCYLSKTQNHGIYFSTTNTPSLHTYVDADWAGNSADYTSTRAYIVYFECHMIAWSLKKQARVDRSSTEAEYILIASTKKKICWINSLISELEIKSTGTPTIYYGNIGATYLVADSVFHFRMKNNILDYHFVRHQVQQGNVRFSHVASQDQLPDAFTKLMQWSRFQTLLMYKIYNPHILISLWLL